MLCTSIIILSEMCLYNLFLLHWQFYYYKFNTNATVSFIFSSETLLRLPFQSCPLLVVIQVMQTNCTVPLNRQKHCSAECHSAKCCDNKSSFIEWQRESIGIV